MKLKYLISALIVAGVVCGAYAAKDPVLMTINNKKVTLSEFEYLYKKNMEQQVVQESIDEYVERFVNYKLKVVEAEALGYDTLPRIQQELNGYKADMLAPFLTDNDLKEKLVQEAYGRMTKNVDISHMMLARGKTREEDNAQIARMDSLRNCILNGENFNDLVMKYSIDRSKERNKGNYGFIASGMFPYAFEYVAYTTPVGEISKPFLTDYGVHMIRVNAVRPDEGQVDVAHIVRVFPRGVTVNDSVKAAVKASIDSIYARIQAGESFEELAKKYSQDGSARNGGKLPLMRRGQAVEPFIDIAFSLADGEVSQPFETVFGYHIIKKFGLKTVGSLDEMRGTIEQQMQRDERAAMPVDSRVNSIMNELGYKKNKKLHDYLVKELKKHGSYDSTFVADVLAKSDFTIFTFGKNQKRPLSLLAKTMNPKAKYASIDIAVAEIEANVERVARREVVNYYSDNLFELNSDYRNLMNEYRDGTLLFEVMNNEVWKKAKSDEQALQKRFEENRGKYQWDAPHFKGIMVCAKNDSILKAVAAAYEQISNLPEDTVTTRLNKQFGHNIKMVRVITKAGENEMVDNIAFGGKKAPSAYSGYPVYAKLMGRIINQPEELADVKGLVSSDYQDVLEQQWVDGLRKKYKVAIDQKVLNQLKAIYK